MRKKRWLWLLVAVIGIGAITPAVVRVYNVAGNSDSPTFLEGERIVVIHAAYDVRLPFTDIVIVAHSQPQRGDVVMFRPPDGDYPVFKRVVGCPGDSVGMRDYRLVVNGTSLRYRKIDAYQDPRWMMGAAADSIVEEETGNGPPHLILRPAEPGPGASFDSCRVAPDNYFVMGDNRGGSRDSRHYGAIPRGSILGRVLRADRSAK
ncbi:MAG TPA: signal peptidase I [Acidobacteriota bacterium]|nr:signal peptidase I [Acidobacteriota bacterium]